jgi:hypothetical protein
MGASQNGRAISSDLATHTGRGEMNAQGCKSEVKPGSNITWAGCQYNKSSPSYGTAGLKLKAGMWISWRRYRQRDRPHQIHRLLGNSTK